MSNVDEIEDVTDPHKPHVVKVRIPYTPRRHFLPLHRSKKRFKFVVAHRRAGKSVAAINEMIKKAIENTRQFPPPRYGYVGPSFSQTKDLIWGYLKTYAGAIPGTTFLEGELKCTLPNGATITLYGGAAAYERMRGLYFDGIMLDEFPLLNPSVFSTVVRPCLADYRGWAIVSGTSNGDDHFHELKKRAEREPDKWEVMVIPVTETDALHPDEVKEMTSDMTASEYAREMLCRFDAPIEGAYYAEQLNNMRMAGRVTGVPCDIRFPVYTAWDLGIDDFTAIWFFQIIGREIHVIKYAENTGKGLEFYAEEIKKTGWMFGAHIGPHDLMARELGTGKSRYETLQSLLPNDTILVCPMHRVEDGINAARSVLSICYFDAKETGAGLSALQNYQKNTKTGKPLHNWASHGADGFRTLAMGMNMVSAFGVSGNVTSINGALRRRVKGRV